MKTILFAGALLAGFAPHAVAQYPEWRHSGSLYVLTTPEGADLPAGASVEGFPLLLRLDNGSFDFSQATAGGEDIRFSAEGKPLAYQIEEWDAVKGVASIWVRIPVIKGNARQEIKLHWSKADAANESSGAAVFNENNCYASVLHMNDVLKDELGAVKPADSGTTVAPLYDRAGPSFCGGAGHQLRARYHDLSDRLQRPLF